MKQVNMEATGLNIKRLCTSKGLTPKELSTLFNVTLTTPYLWFNGKITPKLDTLVSLSEMLECPLEEMLVIEEEEDGQ